MKPKSQKIIKVLKWSIQVARKLASNHWKLSNIRETIKNSCEGVATVFHRRFEHHQSRWNAWRCSRLANLPWREVQDMHPLPLTFSVTLLSLFFIVDDSGKRPTSPYDCIRLFPIPLVPFAPWHSRLWISSALFHPRRTYFNDSRHREARSMFCPTLQFPNMPRNPRSLIRVNWDFAASVAERAS